MLAHAIVKQREYQPDPYGGLGWFNEVDSPGWHDVSVMKLRGNPGFEVRSFRDLVGLIAQVGNFHSHSCLLFRGQNKDYKDRNHRTKIYPSIFRGKKGSESPFSNARRTTIAGRVRRMREALDVLTRRYRGHWWATHPEAAIALLQHYNVCLTPMVDLTQSLRVATSFALTKDGAPLVEEGFLYVFALPHPHGSISHYIDSGFVMVRLQSVCPPEAYRPHCQEGFLVGRYPLASEKNYEDDISRNYLVGKYKLLNPGGAFWDADFTPLPLTALAPPYDPFLEVLHQAGL